MVFRSWLVIALLAFSLALWGEEPFSPDLVAADSLHTQSPAIDEGEAWQVEPAAPREVVEKEALIRWIWSKQSWEKEREHIFVKDAFAPSVYHFGANYTELHSDPYRISLYGFEHFATLWDKSLYLGYFQRHYFPQYRAGNLDYRHYGYDYEVSLSGIKASIGDYDTRDLAAFLGKRGLFGFENLEFYTDFNLQNGYWLDSPVGTSTLRAYLKYYTPFGDIETEYASFQKEPGSYEMLPNYISSGLYRYKHKYSHLYLKANNPWLELGILSSHDQAKNTNWQQTLKSDNLQISAAQSRTLGALDAGWRYEYADFQRNYSLVPTYNQIDYQHKLSLNLDYDYGIFYLQATPELLDWKHLRSDISLKSGGKHIRWGVYDQRIVNPPAADYLQKSPFNGNNMSGLSLWREWESGILYGWQGNHNVSYIAAGYQKLRQKSLLQDLTDTQFVARINVDYQRDFGNWDLSIRPFWNYQDNKLYLMENPRYRLGSRQELTRRLGYGNALSAGFELQGHSNYYMANVVNPVLIEASTMLDIWAKVKIGELFDFTVQYQNLLNTSIYGVYPIPPSIHAGINWYFIN